jgi:VIT1/CCC1 family predicted Fe2+/Mn2+ transporter
MGVTRRQRGTESSASRSGNTESPSNGISFDRMEQQSPESTTTVENGKSNRMHYATQGRSSSKITDHDQTPMWVYATLIFFIIMTVMTCPRPLIPPHGSSPTLAHVFFYGWITALSTGLGVIPFFFLSEVQSYYVGIANGTCTLN